VHGVPNFARSGRSLEPHLLLLLVRLQRRHGVAFVSEGSLRAMLEQDTGCMPGLDSVRRCLDRLELRGELFQEWYLAGSILPDGTVARKGLRIIRVATSEPERRQILQRIRVRKERGGRRVGFIYRGARDAARRVSVLLSRSKAPGVAMPPAGEAHARQVEAERERQRRAAAAWMAAEREGKPPD
jgi:hypothetical protein